jgi:RND family efflux transporter MFP subunit
MTFSRFYLFIVLVCIFTFNANAIEVKTERIHAQPLQTEWLKTGKTVFKHIQSLSFQRSGYLVTALVNEGEQFQQGDLLAALDLTELKEEKNSRYAELIQAKRDVVRLKKLLPQQLTTEQAIEQAQTREEIARSAYQIAYYNLEKARIIAPFNGVVIKQMTRQGELQLPGSPVIQVAALDHNFMVQVALTESEVAQLNQHTHIDIMLQNQPVLTGEIDTISASADSNTGLFLVHIAFKQYPEDAPLRAGNLAQLRFINNNEQSVFALPIRALIKVNAFGQALFLVESTPKKYQLKAFDIIDQDNQFVYVNAVDSDLNLVTQGWLQLINEVNE